MFEHALVISQVVALFMRLGAFFGTIFLLWILLSFPVGDMPTPSLSDKDCHDVARLWGWKWVDQDNQDMKAKAVTRCTCASCEESKDVRFDNMKKFGPGSTSVQNNLNRKKNVGGLNCPPWWRSRSRICFFRV